MHDLNRHKLKTTIRGALSDIEEMQKQLALIRAQCRQLELAMREIRINSQRNRIYSVPKGGSPALPAANGKKSA